MVNQERVLTKLPDRIPTLKKLISQITPENRHQELSVGPEIGKEAIEWQDEPERAIDKMKHRSDTKEGVKKLKILMEGERITCKRRFPKINRDITVFIEELTPGPGA